MKTITTDELKKMQNEIDDLAVINTLPEESAKEANIPGTPNIPLESDNFVERVKETAGGKDQPVVVYCANTECSVSDQAAKKLEEEGFEKVYDYEGGAKAWHESSSTVSA